MRTILHQALKGNPTAAKEIWNRHDGKVARTENIQLSGTGKPITDDSPPRKLSIPAINRIREIYGLEPVDQDEEKENSE